MSQIAVTRTVLTSSQIALDADEYRMTITVSPAQNGWCVECGADLCHLMFRSGGAAERGAVRLAAAFARCGHDVRVLVRDRSGVLAGALDITPTREMLRQWRAAAN